MTEKLWWCCTAPYGEHDPTCENAEHPPVRSEPIVRLSDYPRVTAAIESDGAIRHTDMRQDQQQANGGNMKPIVVRLSDSVEIWHGDCLDVLPVECDAVVTDPPYFLPATHYNTRSGSARSLTDLGILEHYFSAVFKLAAACKAKWCYAFCDGQSYPVFYATAYPHWKKLRPLIWDKQTSINGYAWRHQHELILFCESESAPTVPTGDGDVLRCRSVPIDDREHMAQKPPELLAQLVRKGDPQTVCDPFMGSGSTGIACIRTGRKFVGIEKDARYFEIARQRLENELRQGMLPLTYNNKPTVET